MTRIVIADGEELYREGLKLILNRSRHLFIVGMATNGAELVDLVKKIPIDVVISEIQLPVIDGIEATRQIRGQNKDVKIIAFTRLQDDQSIVDMVEAGSNGYISKTAGKNELYSGIRQVLTGRIFYCDAIHERISKMITRKNSPRKPEGAVFNKSEREIIKLICQEYASKEIAAITQLAHRTVEKYRERIMQKTGARNVAGIVVYAVKNGLFSI